MDKNNNVEKLNESSASSSSVSNDHIKNIQKKEQSSKSILKNIRKIIPNFRSANV